ncbi:MAG: B12-binding domain-containing radical SAM protein [Aureispira sp.]|nr:B12-binding domain-containing radical SAM protein [Aureispira sp.]
MTKIVFTHGYFIHEDEKEQEIMRPYPPLGILYLSAWLEQHNFPNEVFDTTFSSKEKLYQYLEEQQPDIIPIYTNLMTKVNVIKMVQYIRSNPKLKESIVVLGGPDVTYNIEDYLNTGANIIVIGEGEQTMLEIAQTITQGNRLEFGHITGLAYRNGEGDIIKTAQRQRIRPVDALPFPNRKKIDLHQYLDAWKKRHGLNAVSISTQRGCPYTCKWCSTAVYGQSYRRRSPDKVVDELLYIKEHYNPDTVWFVDDVFTVSHKWLKAFKEEVIRRNAVIPFECITRADRMNGEVIQLLKAAGAFRVWIGAESGSQKIIDAMDRRVDVNQVRDMIQLTRKNGIEAGTFIMLGYPGETEEDIAETIHHLKVSNPDYFTITVAYPIKGTGLYDRVEALQTKELVWNTSTDRDRDFKRTYPRRFYDFAVQKVVNEVHYHKQTLEKGRFSKSAIKFKLKALKAALGMQYTKRF